MPPDHQQDARKFIELVRHFIQYLEQGTPFYDIPGVEGLVEYIQELTERLGYPITPVRFQERGDPTSEGGRDKLLVVLYPRRQGQGDGRAFHAFTTLLTVYYDANGRPRRVLDGPGLKREFRSELLESLRQWITRVEIDWLAGEGESSAIKEQSKAVAATEPAADPPTLPVAEKALSKEAKAIAGPEPAGENNQTATTMEPFGHPMAFADSPTGSCYDFGRRRLLWELWKVLWNASRKYEPSDLQKLVPRWNESCADVSTVKSALSQLRSFWRKKGRADLADRIKHEGGAIWIEERGFSDAERER